MDMEGLLLNVLFLIIFLLFVPSILEKYPKRLSDKHKNIVMLISAGLAVIGCITFPFVLGGGIIFDLRGIPIILLGLYGRIRTSAFLAGLAVLYRFLDSGLGAAVYSSILIKALILIALILVAPIFQRVNFRKKILIGCTFLFVTSLFVLAVVSVLSPVPITLNTIVFYILLNIFCIMLLLYFYEIMNEACLLKNKLLKTEKIKVVSHLAASISHEVRNPLTVVKGFLQVLEQEISDQKHKGYIHLSLHEVDRANDIIVNYLTFAKPAPENMEKLDLKQELERAVKVILPMANMNSVVLETKLGEYYIKGDSQLLQQSLLNILKNSIEAMPYGGKLGITTRNENEKIVIEIEDNGIGMTKEQLSRLGEPYFTTKGREGTGLGMMVAFQIIEMLHGEINVTSEVNLGTTITILLPKLD